MRKKMSRLTLWAVVVLASAALAGCGGGKAEPVEKIEPAFVAGVSISYNGETVDEGVITVDLAAESISIAVSVTRTGTVSDAYELASSAQSVATVDNTGVISPVGVGETVITATAAADRSVTASVVVRVIDTSTAEKYAVTVVGGAADTEEAAAGITVRLTADPARGMRLSGWEYSVEGVRSNGNIFNMPASDVTVTAVYEPIEYGLEITGGGYLYRKTPL